MPEWQDPEVTVPKVRTLERKLHRVGIEGAKFIAAFVADVVDEDHRIPKRDWKTVQTVMLYFEVPNTAEIYSIEPMRYTFPLAAKWEEKAKMDLDFWEKVLIWQSEHHEFFDG